MRLLERGDVATLTTNAVAERAGVAIGTLYQYFADKEAILDALARREVEALGAKSFASLTEIEPGEPGDRIRLVVRAVLDAYGGRARVHRLLMEYGLGRGTSTRLNPLYQRIAGLLSTVGVVGHDGRPRVTTPADAFVLTYAIAGVLRGYIASNEALFGRKEVEDALVRLSVNFLSGAASSEPETRPASQPLRPRRSRPTSRSTPGRA